jgi:hypothetical protein
MTKFGRLLLFVLSLSMLVAGGGCLVFDLYVAADGIGRHSSDSETMSLMMLILAVPAAVVAFGGMMLWRDTIKRAKLARERASAKIRICE